MPKRKKHPRLPNGYGQIRYLGTGRTLPYAVHPPSTERDENGNYIRVKALCYTPDWYTAFAVLTAYHSGTYKPGLEVDLAFDRNDIDSFCRKVMTHSVYQAKGGMTLETVYKAFIEFKFGEHAPKQLSQAARNAYDQGWKYLKVLASRPIESVTVDDLQAVVNECPLKKATKENIVMTAKQIFKYALQRDICEKDAARYLVVPAGGEDEHGVPFTDEELTVLWKNRDKNAAKLLLVLCYSGFRIGALPSLEINTDEWYFKGGVKTAAGKNRTVPIHSGIRSLLPVKMCTVNAMRRQMMKFMSDLGMNHTPHDCRHTFSALCERYRVNDADRRRMMGHSFGNDITNGVYGHRTLEELRSEIEKIKIVGICDH